MRCHSERSIQSLSVVQFPAINPTMCGQQAGKPCQFSLAVCYVLSCTAVFAQGHFPRIMGTMQTAILPGYPHPAQVIGYGYK